MAPKEEEKVETKEEVKAEAKEEAKEEVKGEAKEEAKDEAMEEKKEEPKEPEPPKELEEDAPAVKGAKAKGVAMDFDSSTLNVMPSAEGKLLRTLSEGGMQHLLASVRSNTGIKSGRYMFEVRIVESLSPEGESRNQPKQLVRVGFSTAASSLFLADGDKNFCFDSEGFFVHDKARKKLGQKFSRDQTVAILLNLDASSPNKNTVSLFVNGVRASQPQPVPEELCGKALFPTVTYKNVSLEVNLGPVPRKALPFSCHMVGGAAAADVEVTPKAKAGGKKEVVFPVGLPEHGFFDWVDEFIQKHPSFVELSDRKIAEWATKSGVWKPKASSGGSNDKPDAKFGIPELDNGSIRKVLSAVAPVLQRNYIVAELKANLVAEDRAKELAKFSSHDFTRKAVVMMGEPAKEYKDFVHSIILSEKKRKAEAEQKRKAQEEERKRMLELKKQKAEEAKKAREAAQKKKAGEETKEEEPKADEAAETKAEDTKMEEAPPVIELTEEEKKLCYRKLASPDLSDRELTKSYAKFSLPTKEEGFDDVSFAWQKEAECAAALKTWILEKKLTQRAEDLQPGADFKEAWPKWQKTLQEWRRKQGEYKDPAKRKAAAAKKVEDAKKKLEEEKKALVEAGNEEGAKALEEEAKKAAEAAPMEIDLEELDVFSVTDITDLGNGMPLFSKFTYEDWTMLSTRYELHLLMHSFKKDLNDPDRPGFGEKHLGFYYQRYFKKTWNFPQFNIPKFEDFLEVIKDTVSIKDSFLKAEQAEDTPLETFVKLAEEHRKERERRVDAGDETAKLKFSKPQPPRPDGAKGSAPWAKGNGKGDQSYSSQKRPHPSSSYSQPAKKPAYGSYGGGYGGGYGGYRR